MSKTIYYISGGSSGLGFQLVRQISAEPSNLVIASARNLERSPKLVDISNARPNVKPITVDVSDEASVQTIKTQIKKIGVDHIDVFISNAAIADSFYTIDKTPKEVFLSHYITNTLGPILVYQQLYDYILKGNTKKIIFVSSVAGSMGNFFPVSNCAYGQSKAALNYTSKVLSAELANEEVVVVAVHPGVVSTPGGVIASKKLLELQPELKSTIETLTISEEESVRLLLEIIKNLKLEDTGKFLNNDGTEIPW
ncbi:hypothetical protein PACTADRAFT_36395 [Pachysolen tannophilus NRRL Y-2460]|uniref:Ketoreductase (KR) domain-containing protein n=1 Tax=Pachysolen tannophilus NRRL Y-2460 TaxID=669874 RepID=A0A1E4U1V7_PACTA|nr:hypothetical protein PACTADRAFT_36395 [Pachysolen tannophilus NRRL Y-2460]